MTMPIKNEKQACTKRHYQVIAKDLPLSCPPRDLRVWDAHPRVYLPIEELGTVTCPYCDAKYTLAEAVTPSDNE